MKRSSIAVWIIIGLIILGIVIWVATHPNDDPSSESSSRDQNICSNFLKNLSKRIQEIQVEITSQMEVLKLTLQMQQFLNKKLNGVLTIIKIVTGVLLLSVIGILMLNGVEFWAAILAVSSFVCVGVPVLTFFFFKEIMDVRELMNWFFKNLKELIYKRFRCDSETVYVMKCNITARQMALEMLQEETIDQ